LRARGAAHKGAADLSIFSSRIAETMNDRFNTIAGWALGGGIVLLGGTLVAGELLHGERPEKMGYPIQGVQEEGGSGAAAADPPVAAVLATADVARGETQFRKCAACHTINQGGANGIGPNLYGVVGEAIASGRGGFAFSEPLKGHGGNWDFDNLYAWLRNPRAFASGTKMTFAGISNPQDRADVILYLNAQGSNLPLPAAPAPGAAAGSNTSNAAAPAGNAAAPAPGGATSNASTNSTVPGAAHDQPVQNSAQVARQPRGNAGGEAAPQPGGH
jgi:cytochrome c